MRLGYVALLATTLGCLATSAIAGSPAVVDFDDPSSLLFPSPYGQAFGNTPGQVVISQNGINMSLDIFLSDPSPAGFFKAEIDGPLKDSFPTNPLELDNISAMFDFSAVGFSVTQVTLDFEKLGGTENFAVNGGGVLQRINLPDLPANIAPGVTASVIDGTVTLSGPISSFLIGGQELAIDNVTAVPEPSSLLLLFGGAIAVFRRRLHRTTR